MVLFPASLRRGDRVGVTFPSAGVEGPGADRIDFCVRWLRDAGIDVVVGDLMDGTGITSGPAAMCNLAGTPYGDVAGFGRQHADDGLIVYVEAAGDDAATTCRNLHGLRLAGWFEHAHAILIGRTNAPDHPKLTQQEAVIDALGRLDCRSSLTLRSATSHHTFPWSTGRWQRSSSIGTPAKSCSSFADDGHPHPQHRSATASIRP